LAGPEGISIANGPFPLLILTPLHFRSAWYQTMEASSMASLLYILTFPSVFAKAYRLSVPTSFFHPLPSSHYWHSLALLPI
jgi:hypothetical protein